MKCFYHHDRDAVGQCKSCGKGLCPNCAVDLDKGLACQGRCEKVVQALIRLIDSNVRTADKTASLLGSARQANVWAALFNVALGAVFLVWGLLLDPKSLLLAVMGGIFLAFGFYSVARAFQMPRFDASESGKQEN